MKSLIGLFALYCGLLAQILTAQTPDATPVITAVENNYSFAIPGMPNSGIAQGSIFVIFGSRLALTSTDLQTMPVTTLRGVSVTVTVGGIARQALLYYVTPTQIAAVLPSSVPAGAGQITVSRSDVTSAPAPIQVVQSGFGIMTLNNGTGPAAAYDDSFHLLEPANAANPGDIIELWGTGTGPVSDDTRQSSVTTNLEVLIGGIPARVLYQGRSQYPGLDQLNVVVPADVSGCYVSVVVRTGNIVSNFSSIPVVSNGRRCYDTTVGPGLFATQLQSLKGRATVNRAAVGLGKDNVAIGSAIYDLGYATFDRVIRLDQYDAYVTPVISDRAVSVGSCTVYAYANKATTTTSGTPVVTTPVPAATTKNLNAGPVIRVHGIYGDQTLRNNNGGYFNILGGTFPDPPVFIPPGRSAFTFDNGSGGSDVGPFGVQVELDLPLLSNVGSIGTINRSQDFVVTWTGADDPEGFVSIGGDSSTNDGTQALVGAFVCTAPAAAHQFTIPAAVLLALPPTGMVISGGESSPMAANLAIIGYSPSTTLAIPGFDLAYAFAFSQGTAVYK